MPVLLSSRSARLVVLGLTIALVLFFAPARGAETSFPVDRGLLLFKDGNRATGRLLGPGVFASDRFGEIRFTDTEARFEPASPPTLLDAPPEFVRARIEANAPPAASAPAAPPAEGDTGSGPPWWHPWTVSFSGFVERAVDGDNNTRDYYANLRLDRPRVGRHQVMVEARYELEEEQGRLDERKATLEADWRRDLAPRWFTLYRPDLEYNGIQLDPAAAAILGEARADYLLGLHHLGLGHRLVDRPALRSNFAAGWAYLHLTPFGYDGDDAHGPALLFENEFKLSRGLEFSQLARAYHPTLDDFWYWENEFALTKRFTEHFFLTLRHEYRTRYAPLDIKRLDKLRLLFGVKL